MPRITPKRFFNNYQHHSRAPFISLAQNTLQSPFYLFLSRRPSLIINHLSVLPYQSALYAPCPFIRSQHQSPAKKIHHFLNASSRIIPLCSDAWIINKREESHLFIKRILNNIDCSIFAICAITGTIKSLRVTTRRWMALQIFTDHFLL